MRVPYSFIAINVVGMLVITASWLSTPAAKQRAIDSQAVVVNDYDPSTYLVQEPSRRRAQRPQLGNGLPNNNQRSSWQMLSAFRQALGGSQFSTVEVIIDDQRVAYGTVVHQDGWIISKDSQIPLNQKVVCRFADGSESNAQVVEHNSSLDLVLLKVTKRNLPAIKWANDQLPPRGNWVATPDTGSTPAAVGVVSAGLMTVAPQKVRLGVKLEDSNEGALISEVIPGTGAEMAGLQAGDKIVSVDGQKLANRNAVHDLLESCAPGQQVKLIVLRGMEQFEALAQMMDLAIELLEATEMEVNGLVSARSTGFSKVFLHDTVLSPNQCGGPLVNLNGQVVGINIARAGRVSSYALPVSTVRPRLNGWFPKRRPIRSCLPMPTCH